MAHGMDLNRHVPKDAYPAGDMPEYPARTLLYHVLAKGVQLGATVGVVIAPIWSLSRARALTSIYHKVVISTAALSTVASVGMLAGRGYQGRLTPDGVDDRAYRISHNTGQQHVDQVSVIGAAAGASYGAIFGHLGLRSVLSGSLTGVALAVASHGVQLALQESDKDAVPAAKQAPQTQLK